MFRFLRLFLAVFRLMTFIRYDDFPLMKWLREEWALFKPEMWSLLHCHRCVGMHAAWIVVCLNRFKATRWIVDVLALAGAEVLVHDLVWKE